ncbi:flagellar basal-body MS-ring/collar protein FliF [Halomonas salinarum]|uniref:flagellar basal-body MS-ring/collar protein FliF n=1 Tax=Halomonas salinarum TaxID=1158993 RepID=UPI00143B039C|nr:flagellar basal-body MS-ring/collar protein FliF [Halomonas salinarum]
MSNGATATDSARQGNTPSSKASGSKTSDSASQPAVDRIKDQLKSNPMIPLLIALAAVIAIVIALLMWAQSPNYRVLYSNLSEADGGRIISELDSRQVPYEFGAGGSALLVPSDKVHMLRLQLAEQGLPQGGNVGFEIMDNQAFGISQFAEQVNFQRGLEGELASSMEALGPVSKARIHLAMAKPSVFVREEQPAKASVVLTLQPGRVLGEGQITAIMHMVSSSVPDLATENVTVVDQDGRLLSQPGGSSSDLNGTQLDYIAEVENSYQRRIESILNPILGSQNIHAQVAAQIDFSRREETAERYGPNQAPNEAAIRSAQTSGTYTGGNQLAQGVPGALTNTPPGAEASPIDQADAEAGANTEEGDPPSRLSQDNVINYEVDRNVAHIQHQRGQIERLNVAVVVNYRQQMNDEGNMEMVALSDDEIAQIERLVRQSMGFSQARGDAIEVVNSPFTQQRNETVELAWWQQPDLQQLAFSLGRYLLVGLAILLLYLLILRPLIKRQTAQPTLQGPGSTISTAVGQDSDDGDTGAVADVEESPAETYSAPRRPRKSSSYESNLQELRELAQEDPRLVAMIVRSWMKNDE